MSLVNTEEMQEEYKEYRKRKEENGDLLWRYHDEKQIIKGSDEEIRKIESLCKKCKEKEIFTDILMKISNIKFVDYSYKKRSETGAKGEIRGELKEEYREAKTLIVFLEKEIEENKDIPNLKDSQLDFEEKPKNIYKDNTKQTKLVEFIKKEVK